MCLYDDNTVFTELSTLRSTIDRLTAELAETKAIIKSQMKVMEADHVMLDEEINKVGSLEEQLAAMTTERNNFQLSLQYIADDTETAHHTEAIGMNRLKSYAEHTLKGKVWIDEFAKDETISAQKEEINRLLAVLEIIANYKIPDEELVFHHASLTIARAALAKEST